MRDTPITGESGGSSGCKASRTPAFSATGTTLRRKYSKLAQSSSSVMRRRFAPGARSGEEHHPAVADHRDLERAGIADDGAELLDLRIAAGAAALHLVHRDQPLDAGEIKSLILEALLQRQHVAVFLEPE